MKILTDQAHPIIDWALKNAGHTVERISQENLAADLFLLKSLESFRVLGLMLQKAGITKYKVILFPQSVPYPFWEGKQLLSTMAQSPNVVGTVFYHEFQRRAWEFKGKSVLIEPTLNFSLYPSWEGGNREIVTVSSNMRTLDWATGTSIWHEVTRGLPKKLIGSQNETLGRAEDGIVGYMPHPKVITAIKHCQVYLNPAIHLPLPYPFLEAMAMGAPIITNKSPLAFLIFSNVKETMGFMSPVVHELRCSLVGTLGEKDFCATFKDLGVSARLRAYTQERFSTDKFNTAWNKLFEESL